MLFGVEIKLDNKQEFFMDLDGDIEREERKKDIINCVRYV